MQKIPDEPPHWIGFGVQQQSADELLLAEVVKEVVITLRSRGVSHSQAAIEAYHTACDLVRQRSSSVDRSPLAQITTALHVFCLAMPPNPSRASSFPPDMSNLSTTQEIQEPSQEPRNATLPKKRARFRERGKIYKEIEEDEPDGAAILFRHNQLRTMPYHEYLQTPEWQARRREKLSNAGNRCQVCNGKNGGLEVHHRTYKRRGYEKEQDLIVLCEECHTLFHDRMQKSEDEPE